MMPEPLFTLAEELLLLALDDETGELRGHPNHLLAGAAIMECVLRGLIRPIAPHTPEWFPAVRRLVPQVAIPDSMDAETHYQELYRNIPSFVWRMMVGNQADISLPPLEAYIWSKVEAATLREAEPSIFHLGSVVDFRLFPENQLFRFGVTRLLERGILYKAERRSLLRPYYIDYPKEKRDRTRELRDGITGWLLRIRSTVWDSNEETSKALHAERSRMLGFLVWQAGLLPYLVRRSDHGATEWRIAKAVRLSTELHSAISCVHFASLNHNF